MPKQPLLPERASTCQATVAKAAHSLPRSGVDAKSRGNQAGEQSWGANLLADDVDLWSVTVLHVRNGLREVKRPSHMIQISWHWELWTPKHKRLNPMLPLGLVSHI